MVHTKGMQEAVAKTGRYDVMMPTAMSYPDWINSGVIYDLTDWVQKYDPEIFNKEWGVVFPASHHAQLYNGRVAGLLNDGDQLTLLCRDDYLTSRTRPRLSPTNSATSSAYRRRGRNITISRSSCTIPPTSSSAASNTARAIT